ncbi:MAG: hypothetical protein COW27_00205 [Nitrosopumilales archaeon CG15_BIG_FIL_POST_REV_8_21_14_020_37_12]|nr:MAG: hypothetical protein COW27_00205 [Nitrosopumilales archaeon CG15_BIG_FIL_POST_REV_8_21_14_020_37_12]
MKKIIVIIPIIIAVIGLIVVSESNNEVRIDKAVFHVTLADPEMYQDGVYTDMFSVEAGNYFFRFIPNGDSPKSLSISLKGKNLNFYEDFRLNGTLHETGISQYYTWDYDGQKQFVISEQQEITIEINPNGSILGSVSVSILQN